MSDECGRGQGPADARVGVMPDQLADQRHLTIFFLRAAARKTNDELVRATGREPGAVAKELGHLHEIGFVTAGGSSEARAGAETLAGLIKS